MTTIRLELGNFGFDAGNRKGKTFAGLSLVWLLIADGMFVDGASFGPVTRNCPFPDPIALAGIGQGGWVTPE